MAFSYRDNVRQRPNFATMGTGIPDRLRRARPAWVEDPPVIPPRNPNKPFDDPPRPAHELDPPERNPYNDPDYSPFIVTENQKGQAGEESAGGLLGMLLTMMPHGQVQLGADPPSVSNRAPEYDSKSYGSPQGSLFGKLPALQPEPARNAVDAYVRYDPDRASAARTTAAPPQEMPTTEQRPVRILSRRLYR